LAKLKDFGVEKVFCVGLAYDFCVGSTAIDSAKNGFDTYLLKDFTRAVSEPTTLVME